MGRRCLSRALPGAARAGPGCATSGISSGYLAAFTPGSAATWIRSGQTRTGLRISTRDFHLTMPGKAMAYAGLGQLTEEFIAGVLTRLAELDGCWDAPARIYPAVEPAARRLGLSGADVLAGFQEALAGRLVAGLAAARERLPEPVSDLCFAGGSRPEYQVEQRHPCERPVRVGLGTALSQRQRGGDRGGMRGADGKRHIRWP
jgi:hypothetical protein